MDNNSKPIILVVDDSDLTRSALKSIFSKYNCELITCIDGLDGIQKALFHKPDLIVLDILMPNLDGIKMLKVIKIIDELKEIPVIVLSANTNLTNVKEALESGADKIVNKPFKEDLLINCASELLKHNLILKEQRKHTQLQADENIFTDLKKIFVETFSRKEDSILQAITSRDKEKVKTIFHELKGIGTTIGLPEVTNISRKIEYAASAEKVDWHYITNQCNQMFSFVDSLQSIVKAEN